MSTAASLPASAAPSLRRMVVPLALAHFICSFAGSNSRPASRIRSSSVMALVSFSWPPAGRSYGRQSRLESPAPGSWWRRQGQAWSADPALPARHRGLVRLHRIQRAGAGRRPHGCHAVPAGPLGARRRRCSRPGPHPRRFSRICADSLREGLAADSRRVVRRGDCPPTRALRRCGPGTCWPRPDPRLRDTRACPDGSLPGDMTGQATQA